MEKVCSSLVPRPHPANGRRRGLVSRVQLLGPAEVPKKIVGVDYKFVGIIEVVVLASALLQ